MTDDARMTWGFIFEILDVLDRHGYRRSDNQHTAQAIGLLGDLARTYEGTMGAPRGVHVMVPAPAQAAAQPPGHADHDAVVLSAAEVKTIVAALDEASLYKRDRVATCADCADQSCGPCQWRLQAASAHDELTTRLLDTAAAPGRHRQATRTRAHIRHLRSAAPSRQRSRPMTGPAREHGHGTQPQDAQPGSTYRPPDYLVVASASDWVEEHFPGRRSQPPGRAAHRQRPPARSRTRSGSRTMTATRK